MQGGRDLQKVDTKWMMQYPLEKSVEKVVEKPLRINKGAYKERAWDTDTWVADISKTTSALDWKPTYSLQEGIKAYIEWYINNIK